MAGLHVQDGAPLVLPGVNAGTQDWSNYGHRGDVASSGSGGGPTGDLSTYGYCPPKDLSCSGGRNLGSDGDPAAIPRSLDSSK